MALPLLLLAAWLAARPAAGLSIAGVDCPGNPTTIAATGATTALGADSLRPGHTYILHPGAFAPADFTLSREVVLPPAGAPLCIVGASGNASDVVLKSADSGQRHFAAAGSLGLANTTLDGGGIGGGIYACCDPTRVLGVQNVLFTRCYGNDGGGAAVYLYPGLARFVDTRFVSNTGWGGGGAVFANSANVAFEGATVMRDNSADCGGALQVSSSTVTISGAACITGNSATTYGGAVYLYASTLDFQPGTAANFGGNSAPSGPAIAVEGNGKFTCSGERSRGGGYYTIEGAVCAPECTGTSCTCLAGAALDAASCSCPPVYGTIAGVDCPGNPTTIAATGATTALDAAGLRPGHTYILHPGAFAPADFTLSREVVLPPAGAPLCIVGASGNASDVVLKSADSGQRHFAAAGSLGLANTTLDGGGIGGGIYACCDPTRVLGVQNVLFTRCYGNDGGGAAVYLYPGLARFVDTRFVSNTGWGGGGAVFANSANVAFEGATVMRDNSADCGGALQVSSSTVTISGAACITGNSATTYGGAVYLYASTLDFQPGTAANFGGNSAPSGPAIAVEGNGKFTCSGERSRGGGYYTIEGAVCAPECTGTSCTCPAPTAFDGAACACSVALRNVAIVPPGPLLGETVRLSFDWSANIVVASVAVTTSPAGVLSCPPFTISAPASAGRITNLACTAAALGSNAAVQATLTGSDSSLHAAGAVSSVSVYPVPPPSSAPPSLLLSANMLWPASCVGLANGSRCVAQCKGPSYGQVGANPPPLPSALWSNGQFIVTQTSASCEHVCAGLPPASWLPGGAWPASCNSRISAAAGVCIGVCGSGYAGSPRVACNSGVWMQSTLLGHCLPLAQGVCLGLPTVMVTNMASWSASACWDSPGSTSCFGTCNPNYLNGIRPRVACVVNATAPTRARWASNYTGSCIRR